MERKFTLRQMIERERPEFFGKPDWMWLDEGLPWIIQNYHGSVGSVMDFTEDDWQVCKENGWSLNEVLTLCDENLILSLTPLMEGVTKEDAIAAVEDFYTWFLGKLPKVEEIFGNG